MATADVLDAPPPGSRAPRRRGGRSHPLRHRGAGRAPGQRARPELPPDRCVRRSMGAQGLERRRGPRRGRDGGGRRRADRRGRPRASRCPWHVPRADGSTITRAEVEGTSHLVRLLPLLPGRTARASPSSTPRRSSTSARWSPASDGRCAASSIPLPAGRSGGTRSICPSSPAAWRSTRGLTGASCWERSWPGSTRTWSRRSRRCARSSSTTTSRSTTCCSTARGGSPGSSTSATWRTPRSSSTSRPRSSHSSAVGPTCSR